MKKSEMIKDIIEKNRESLTFEQLIWLVDEYKTESSLEDYAARKEQKNAGD